MMVRASRWWAVALISIFLCGCGGDNRLRTAGKVVRGGTAVVPTEGQLLRVAFFPMTASTGDSYVAEVDRKDGTFRVSGKDGKGMPPGKYRAMVELQQNRKDTLNGAFGPDNSPLEFDVTSSTREIVLDLDKK